MNFPCTACGCCCRRVHLDPSWPRGLLKPDGSCVHLLPDDRCRIYEARPPVCRIGHGLAASGLTEGEYLRATAALCNQWQDEDGIEGKKVAL